MKRAVTLVLLASFACLAAAPSGAQSPGVTPGSGNAAFVSTARTHFYDGFRESPVGATLTGYHAYDTQLDDVRPAAWRAHFRREHQVLRALQAIDPATLSPDVAIDRTMLIGSIREDLLWLDERSGWRHNPDDYTQTVANAVYAPISRAYAPLRTRMQDVIARERAIPALLVQARANITTVDPSTLESSQEDAAGTIDLFKTTLPSVFKSAGDRTLQHAFALSNANALAAVSGYSAWLKGLRASGTFALGAPAYARLLQYEDAVDTPLPQLLGVARAAFLQTRTDYVATAKKIDPHLTAAQVYAKISRVHPTGNALLAAAQNDLVGLRAFLIARHIVTVPAAANIRVTETPEFERSTIQAAMDAPGPLETVATRAYYFVTPPDPTWSKAETEGYLAQFSDFERPILSAHEVYPGHYLNFTVDRQLPLSLTRKLLSSGSFVEGWAHYDEQMVVDEGWGNGDPRVRLAQLEEAILRNCRFVAGIGLHTGNWSEQRAERFFETQCFQPKGVAEVEALRGTQDPLYGRYTMGKLMIFKLRRDYRAKLGANYTLQKFHDEFLAHGQPPIPLLRKLMLGASDDGSPL